MPNIQSAIKKMRQDVKRTRHNTAYKKTVKQTLKNMSTMKDKQEIAKAYAVIDKAAKKKIIHKNKAARLKSQISRITAGK